MAFNRLTVTTSQLISLIIEPGFSDINPIQQNYNGTLNEFTLLQTNGKSKIPLMNLKGRQNIMKRRDASCDLIYEKVMGASTRIITVDEVYGATKFCSNEFYQGCLKDWRAEDPIFRSRILPFFQQAMYNDLVTNSYFGDVARVKSLASEYSTTAFDGIWKWIKKFTTAGLIPTSQALQIPGSDDYFVTPIKAFQLIEAMYAAQSRVLKSTKTSDKAFYVSEEIAEAYERYLISVGEGNTAYIDLVMNGIPTKQLAYRQIPILVEPTWSPVLFELAGKTAYAAILTFRGNLGFAVDERYGEGPDNNIAMQVWYDDDKMTWKYREFLRVGTGISLPEHIVYAISAF